MHGHIFVKNFMHKPETGTNPRNKTKMVTIISDFYLPLFPKFSTIIIYYFCEYKKTNVFKRCAQKQKAGV